MAWYRRLDVGRVCLRSICAGSHGMSRCWHVAVWPGPEGMQQSRDLVVPQQPKPGLAHAGVLTKQHVSSAIEQTVCSQIGKHSVLRKLPPSAALIHTRSPCCCCCRRCPRPRPSFGVRACWALWKGLDASSDTRSLSWRWVPSHCGTNITVFSGSSMDQQQQHRGLAVCGCLSCLTARPAGAGTGNPQPVMRLVRTRPELCCQCMSAEPQLLLPTMRGVLCVDLQGCGWVCTARSNKHCCSFESSSRSSHSTISESSISGSKQESSSIPPSSHTASSYASEANSSSSSSSSSSPSVPSQRAATPAAALSIKLLAGSSAVRRQRHC